jgi:hypothetical protein
LEVLYVAPNTASVGAELSMVVNSFLRSYCQPIRSDCLKEIRAAITKARALAQQDVDNDGYRPRKRSQDARRTDVRVVVANEMIEQQHHNEAAESAVALGMLLELLDGGRRWTRQSGAAENLYTLFSGLEFIRVQRGRSDQAVKFLRKAIAEVWGFSISVSGFNLACESFDQVRWVIEGAAQLAPKAYGQPAIKPLEPPFWSTSRSDIAQAIESLLALVPA